MTRVIARVQGLGPGAAAAVYGALSFAFFLRPVLGDPTDLCVCLGPGVNPDAYLFVWSFEWWPHALTQLEDPITSKAIFWPEGANLAQATTVPGPALAAAPLTAIGGPLFGYNVVTAFAPALSAFTAFLLCRRLTRRFLPALFGGYLFGFSSYVLAHLGGHMNLFLVFLIPVLVHLTLRHVDGELSTRRFALFAGLVLFAQLLTSTEILFTSTVMAVISLALAYGIFEARRERLRETFAGVAGAYLLAGVLGAVFIYNALRGGGPNPPPIEYGLDPLNMIFPTAIAEFGGRGSLSFSSLYPGGFAEAGAYLGIPLVAIAAHYLVTSRRRRSTWFIAAVAGLALVLALGSQMTVRGVERLPAPWTLLDGLPLFEGVQPVRLAMFATLALAVAAALWLREPGRRPVARYAVAALAALALFPNLGDRHWYNRPEAPPFFVDGGWRDHLDHDDVALLLPHKFTGRSMLWQARTGIGFRMAGGYIGETGHDPDEDEPLYEMFRDQRIPAIPNASAELADYIERHEVKLVVVDPGQPSYWPDLLSDAGFEGRTEGGMLIFPTGGSRAADRG